METIMQALAYIVGKAESGELPVAVQEVYAHGLYTLDSSKPPELGVIVVYRQAQADFAKNWSEDIFSLPCDDAPETIDTAVRNYLTFALLRREDHVLLELVQAPCDIRANAEVLKPLEVGLIWSDTDRDWQEKVRSLADRGLLRGPMRETPVFGQKFHPERNKLPETVNMVASGRLTLTRIPLQKFHAAWLDEVSLRRLDRLAAQDPKDIVRRALVPYVLLWFGWQQETDVRFVGSPMFEAWNDSDTLCIQMGRPSLARMIVLFFMEKSVEAQAMLPDLTGGGNDEMLVFQRGPNWKGINFVKAMPPEGRRRLIPPPLKDRQD